MASKKTIHLLLIIILISSLFGALGFLYSFFGLLEQQRAKSIIPLDPFRLLTLQEIGGHFLFGVIVSLPSKNPKMGLLTGLMAVTIDSDHFLNLAGFHVQLRIDHSIPFAILSSILIGIASTIIYDKISNAKEEVMLPVFSNKYKKLEKVMKNYIPMIRYNNNNIFSQFLLITLAAFISHIAYDVFVDDRARFPLLAPFSFTQFIIPRSYGLLIEAGGIFLIYLFYNKGLFASKKSVAINNYDKS